ncbi:MAG: RHS repeat-associated core domain-containing protein [Bacilli bacterium]|nr:RHS repeat-associated core domain-containing protein [Bacilli bacterium]
MADLSHITIDQAPNKTTYMAGDRFERYGMAVRAHYTDGTSSLTGFYSYSPSGALSTSDTQITVEFSGKTAAQAITVLPAPQEGYFGTRYLGGAEYGGNPCVNACDFSVRFRNGPIALGSGPYRIGLTLSYCSGMPGRESDLIKGLPRGWRTDWHRFLVQDGADQSDDPLYKYVDGDGYVHCFEHNVSTGSWHDAHGQGLTLDPAARTITDLSGNVLSFDSSGRLVSMTSGVDPDGEKVVEYNSDGIRKIYDSRDPGTYIKFSYQNSYIKYIRLYKGGDDPIKTYTLGGFPGQIASLDETVGNSTRTLCQYAVNDRDLLRRVVDCMTKDAWRITYEFDQGLNSYRMDSIRKGYLNGDDFAQHEGMYFASRDQDACFGGPCVREFTVANDDGIDVSIMTDSEGSLVSVLERGHANPDRYFSLVREEGKRLGDVGPGPETVNGSAARGFFGELYVTGINIPPGEFGGSFGLRLIGWVRIDNRPSRARLSASSQGFVCGGAIDLNPKAYKVWQRFELPITRVPSGVQAAAIESFELSLRDADGCQIYALAAGLQIAKDEAKRSSLFFVNQVNPVTFGQIQEIRLYDSPSEYTAFGAGSPVYMTEADLLMTMEERFRSPTGPWKAYFNGGREIRGYSSNVVGHVATGLGISFFDPNFVNNATISDGPSANWYFAESENGSDRTYYRFSQSHYEVVRRTASNAETINRYDYQGRLILSENASERKTKYEYFPDGRLKKAGILSASDESSYENVLYEASLDQNDMNVARLTQGGMSRDFQYHSDGLLWKTAVNSVQGGQISNTACYGELSYDVFRSELAGAMFKNGEVIQEEHSYSRPSQSYKTNHFGDIAGMIRVGHEISTRTTTLGIHDGSDYADVLVVQESAHAVTRTYDNCQTHGGGYQEVAEEFDEYGFPASISYGGVPMATFAYEENFASRYCSLLKSVTDLFSGRDIIIHYGDGDEVSSVQVGGFRVSYSEGRDGRDIRAYAYGADEAYAVEYAGTEALSKKGGTIIDSSKWSYSYDDLGRVASKTDDRFFVNLIQTYQYSTDLPSRVASYSFGNSYSESYSYGDGFGNITGVGVSSSLFPYASSYQFDGLGRIVSETNSKLEISRSYQYQAMGSSPSGPVGRMSRFGNASMEYDEKGRLAQFGTNFYSYDHYGNRVSKNQVSYQWERGALLSYCGFSRFEYDYKGLRSLKVDASGLTHEYFYDGERLVGEDVRDGSSTVRKLRYFYDLDGLCALRVIEGDAASDYVCIRNPLGDIVGLSQGTDIRALYVYDAWGNHKVYGPNGEENASQSFIGNINPFRYRGYYFDSDTGLYYLRARYYDPEIGQFISPDDVGYMDFESIGGLNLYAYCNYNPVMHSDPSGHLIPEIIVGLIIGAVVGAGVGFGAAAYFDYTNDGELFNGDIQWYDYLGATLLGSVIGAAFGAGLAYFSTLSITIAIPSFLIHSGGATAALPLSITLTGSDALLFLTGLGLIGAGIMFSKHNPGMGNRPLSSDITKDECIEAMKKNHGDSNRAATEIMNNHRTDWRRGAGTEFNALKKFLDRVIRKLLGF